MRDGKMHQTTVRFGPDLWQALEAECSRLGISAAQYLREAALARLAYTAGLARQPVFEAAFAVAGVATGGPPSAPRSDAVGGPMLGAAEEAADPVAAAAEHSRDGVAAAHAVQAQGKLVVTRAATLRARAEELRADARRLRRR